MLIYYFFQHLFQTRNFGSDNLFSDMFVICETERRLVIRIIVAKYQIVVLILIMKGIGVFF
jgi:hypothetical protein